MFENDTSCWKVPRFVKSQEDVNNLIITYQYIFQVNQCIHYLNENFSDLKKLFTYYAALSSFPTISMMDFSNMCIAMNIMDKNINVSTLDRLFIATNVELVDMRENPDKELCRFEILEIMVRIAGAKYKDPGQTKTYCEGLKILIDNHILPFCDNIDWQNFRD